MNSGILTQQQTPPAMPYGLLGDPGPAPMPEAPLFSAFDPRLIPGILLWLDAADSATITLNGSNVSQWRDKSGFGRHAFQTTAANQPAYTTRGRNGRNVLTFTSGSSNRLRAPFMLTLSSETAIVVASHDTNTFLSRFSRFFTQTVTTDGTATGTLSADENAANQYIPIIRDGTSNSFASFFSGAFRASLAFQFDQFAMFSSRHTGTLIANGLNNLTQATFATSQWSGRFNAAVIGASGASAGDGFFTGQMAEVLVYNRALSDSEMAFIYRRYLRPKWNLP